MGGRFPGGLMIARRRLSRASMIAVVASLAALAAAQPVPAVAPPAPGSPARLRAERAAFLEMFARAYFPGRSGQIMIVNREGDILTRHGVDVPFMHGSPWTYDTHIPLIFW